MNFRESASIAAGSRGGSTDHAGTCASSATKKLYRCLETNSAVAGWRTIMSITSSPLKLPVWPRNDFGASSWSSGRYSNSGR